MALTHTSWFISLITRGLFKSVCVFMCVCVCVCLCKLVRASPPCGSSSPTSAPAEMRWATLLLLESSRRDYGVAASLLFCHIGPHPTSPSGSPDEACCQNKKGRSCKSHTPTYRPR